MIKVPSECQNCLSSRINHLLSQWPHSDLGGMDTIYDVNEKITATVLVALLEECRHCLITLVMLSCVT